MRILVAESIAPEGVAALRARHEVDVKTGLSADALREIVGEYDALIVRSQVAVDAALITAGTRLQVIGRAGVGVDNVELDAATRAGITVVNAPTGNTIAAAEHTIALLLALARHIPTADASIRRGEWTRGPLQGVQLSGRTLGIVGLGKIGMTIAERARGPGHDAPRAATRSSPQSRRRCAAWSSCRSRRSSSDRDAVTVHVPLDARDHRPARREGAGPDEARRVRAQRGARRDRGRGARSRTALREGASAARASTCSSTSRRPARHSSTPRTPC